MPSIGNQSDALVWPAWSSPTLRSKIAKWPHPNTVRVDGRLRWLSDPNFYPIATRYVTSMNVAYDNGTPPFFQFYWYDLSHVSGLKWHADSGVNANGHSFELDFQYYDILPHLGVPGCRKDWTFHVNGEPDGTRAQEWSNAGVGYPLNYVAAIPPPTWEDPSGTSGGMPSPANTRWVSETPLSECFPADQLTTETSPMISGPIEIAQFSKTSNQAIATGGAYTPVIWDQQDFGLSTFWNGAGDPTKILIPSGINWIKLTSQLNFGNASGVVIGSTLKNGSEIVGGGATTAENTATDLANWSSGWFPVTISDFLQIGVVVGVARNVVGNPATWLQVEGSQ